MTRSILNSKFKFISTIFLSLILLSSSCQNQIIGSKGGTSATEELPTSVEFLTYGTAFMQPLDTLLSLNMASAGAAISINFIDDEYCSILIYSRAGNVTADRKYHINSDTITFYNPTKGEEKKYGITQNNLGVYYTSKDGIKWRFIESGDSEYNNPYTSNRLKRNAFLYPVLNDEERQFGAEDRLITTKDGRLKREPHPLKAKARETNFLNQF